MASAIIAALARRGDAQKAERDLRRDLSARGPSGPKKIGPEEADPPLPGFLQARREPMIVITSPRLRSFNQRAAITSVRELIARKPDASSLLLELPFHSLSQQFDAAMRSAR